METRADFLEWLGPDTSSSVLMLLDDPADLVRISAVSRSWRRFVIANGFCKLFCLRICPEVSHFARVIEGNNNLEKTVEVGSSTSMERQIQEGEHRAYSYLSYCLITPVGNNVHIADAICASSTDNPEESILNTLIESDRVMMRPSYWSSKGQSDPGVPETLTYRLDSKFCIICEIKVQPFEAYFQPGSPIYSAKTVRFRMGHSLPPTETGKGIANGTDKPFVRTYVSQEFPMVQQNTLQSFKLPRPVICCGGMVQIELSGRVQVQEADRLYYICVSHVQVVGRSLLPAFDISIKEAHGDSVLKYFPDRRLASLDVREPDSDARHSSGDNRFRGWTHALFNYYIQEPDNDDPEPFEVRFV